MSQTLHKHDMTSILPAVPWLTLPVSDISESCIKIKLNLNFYFHNFFVMVRRGVWGSPSNLGPPRIQGSKVPPFSLSISVCRFEHPFNRQAPSPIWPFPFFIFFPNPPLLAKLFRQYFPNELQDNNKNKLMWES